MQTPGRVLVVEYSLAQAAHARVVLEAGADEVLTKPWAPAALIERVAMAIHAVIP